jgi:hypothetical protein
MNNGDGVKIIGIHSDSKRASTVTFKDTPTGVIREVSMMIDRPSAVLGRQASACENLLGIVPGHFSVYEKEDYEPSLKNDSRVMVQCLLPGSAAMKNDVKIGEWLMAVNGVLVDFGNVQAVVDSLRIPCEVRLTLQKIALKSPNKSDANESSRVNSQQLIRQVGPSPIRIDDEHTLQQFAYGAYYLRMNCNSESEEPEEALLYQYPDSELYDCPLVSLHGLFITMALVFRDITGQLACNSTLTVNGQLVHATYVIDGECALVLIVPSCKMSIDDLNHFRVRITRLLCLNFKSITDAFSEDSSSTDLDQLFRLEFLHVLSSTSSKSEAHLSHAITSVHTLPVADNCKLVIDSQLSKLEAADFGDMSEFRTGSRRLFDIYASCLFFRGRLVASHADKTDLLDVWLSLTSNGLLDESEDDHQPAKTVLWKEIYPCRIPGGYSTSDSSARHFLVAVGLNKAVLCALFEANSVLSGCRERIDADPYYVDHLACTLAWLNTQGILQQCDAALQAPPQPSLAQVDKFLHAEKRGLGGLFSSFTLPKLPIPTSPSAVASNLPPAFPSAAKASEPESILKKKPPVPLGDADRKLGIVYDGDSDQESRSTGDGGSPVKQKSSKSSLGSDDGGSVSSTGSSLFKGLRKNRHLSHQNDLNNLKKGKRSASADTATGGLQLNGTAENTLFHYVTIDLLQGIYICPNVHLSMNSKLHTSVVDSFRHSVLQIHNFFAHSNVLLGNDNDAIEHGLLFYTSSESSSDSKKAAAAQLLGCGS